LISLKVSIKMRNVLPLNISHQNAKKEKELEGGVKQTSDTYISKFKCSKYCVYSSNFHFNVPFPKSLVCLFLVRSNGKVDREI
jgi:hypothetical protein